MSRQDRLEKIFHELKASTVDACNCVQNDAPNGVLMGQLKVSNAFNKACQDLVNLGPDNEV